MITLNALEAAKWFFNTVECNKAPIVAAVHANIASYLLGPASFSAPWAAASFVAVVLCHEYS
jgi:hypothetical protein